MLGICAGLKSLNIEVSAIPRQFMASWIQDPCDLSRPCRKASVKTVWAVVGTYASEREQVMANRGITMASSMTRRAPHAFNFLRQVEVLSKAGYGNANQQFEAAR